MASEPRPFVIITTIEGRRTPVSLRALLRRGSKAGLTRTGAPAHLGSARSVEDGTNG